MGISEFLHTGRKSRQLGDAAAALAAFQAAAAAEPEDLAAKIELGDYLGELGRVDEGEAILREVIRRHPHHFEALVRLGYIARRRRDITGSLAAFELQPLQIPAMLA